MHAVGTGCAGQLQAAVDQHACAVKMGAAHGFVRKLQARVFRQGFVAQLNQAQAVVQRHIQPSQKRVHAERFGM